MYKENDNNEKIPEIIEKQDPVANYIPLLEKCLEIQFERYNAVNKEENH